MRDRRLPVGAEPDPGGGVRFRVWAPNATRVEVVLEGAEASAARHPLSAEGDGYFSGTVAGADHGTLYRFRLDGGPDALPDPASRFQPQGPHGPSRVVDPERFVWSDDGWAGAPAHPLLYEMHVGTFTPEGTWDAAREKLPHLAELGVNVLEVMPVADFPGAFGWGYDGVAHFAPYHGYGEPDAFRRFVDRAHALGLAVVLDVVYNHFGPDGNHLGRYAEAYVSRRHETEWGPAFNFDGERSAPVRELCLANVRHWIREYHLDGFRFDATQDLKDDSQPHILAALAREARAAAEGRRVLLIAENEPQRSEIVRPPEVGGFGLDLIVNDDYHHTALVALTGFREGYFSQHAGSAQELVSALEHGFLYQGQHYPWQGKPRGTSTRGLPPGALVHYLENHDQVANGGMGARLHQSVAPGRWRAMVALTLLGPQTPMLFQGQEFRASAPFRYFADQEGELARATAKGRLEFLSQFRNLASQEMRGRLPDPADPETFRSCRLDWGEVGRNEDALRLHRDLIRLRREERPLAPPRRLRGAVIGDAAFLLRALGAEDDGSDDRVLLVNLGADVPMAPLAEPLIAPPPRGWALRWSSESPEYCGRGTPSLADAGAWFLPGGSALLLVPEESEDER